MTTQEQETRNWAPVWLVLGVLVLLLGVILGMSNVGCGSVFSPDHAFDGLVCGRRISERALLVWPLVALGVGAMVTGAVGLTRRS